MGASDFITPGTTPNWAVTPTPAQQGSPGDYGYDQTVRARWQNVPWDKYETGGFVSILATHQCGITFGNDGVKEVRFYANDGAVTVVTSPSPRPGDGLWCHWAYLNTLGVDGPVEIRAAVIPFVGLCRVLQGGYAIVIAANVVPPGSASSLVLRSNGQGTYTKTPVWIDIVNGNDTTGSGTEINPYATIEKALATGYSNLADYGTIYCKAGTYLMSRPAVAANQNTFGWCIIRPAPGLSRSQVVINGGNSGVNVTRLRLTRFQDVTLDCTAGNPAPFTGASASAKSCLWIDGCDVTGVDSLSNPSTLLYGATSALQLVAFTSSPVAPFNWSVWRNWVSGPIGTNFDIGIIAGPGLGGDTFTRCPLVRNFYSYANVDNPLDHSDLWQRNASPSNGFFCDGTCSQQESQLIFLDGNQADNTDIHVFNVALEKLSASALLSQGGGFAFHSSVWHSQLPNQTFRLNASTPLATNLIGFSVVGNVFVGISYNAGGTGISQATYDATPGALWKDNHFVGGGYYKGTGATNGPVTYSGSPGLVWLPTSGVGTTSRTIPWDINQRARSQTTLRGAYAAPSEYTVYLSGPTSGSVGVPSSNFTLNFPTAGGTDTITISISGGGTITPSIGLPGTSPVVVTPIIGTSSFTFTYTPSTAGVKTVSISNNNFWVNPSNLDFLAVDAPVFPIPSCECVSSLTVNQKWDAIYAAWYAAAGDSSLPTPQCVQGLSLDRKMDSVYCAIYSLN